MFKKIFALVALLQLTATVFAQSPDKMSYQSIVRDSQGNLMTSPIGMQLSILQGSTDGAAVYTETFRPLPNVNGLISIEFGGEAGWSFIDWSAGPYFIKTETDPTGGSNYTITGTSQFLSVPYALYAKTSGSSTPGPTGAQGEQGLQGLVGNDGANGKDGSDGANGKDGSDGLGIAQTLSFTSPNLTLSDSGGTVDLTPLINDADSDITNEIQNLSQVLTEGNTADAQIKNVIDPTDAQDAVTKKYVDDLLLRIGSTEKLLAAGFSIEQMLNSGHSISDLMASGLTLTELIAGGASVAALLAVPISVAAILAAGGTKSDLIENGVSVEYFIGDKYLYDNRRFLVSDLLVSGEVSYEILKNSTLTEYQRKDLTVQSMLMEGKTPLEIYTSDPTLLSAIYGKFYAGGYIFSLKKDGLGNILGEGGLVLTPHSGYSSSPTCLITTSSGQFFSRNFGTRSQETRLHEDTMGEDAELTEMLANACPGEVNSATICMNLNVGGFDDWFLPTVATVLEINRNYIFNENFIDGSRGTSEGILNSTRMYSYLNQEEIFDISAYYRREVYGVLFPVRAF